MTEKKVNPLIGAFRDPALDVVQPEKESVAKKPPELSKAAEPAKAPTPDVKQKSEEPAKAAAEAKADKAAEPAKAPAADVKQKPEEPAKPAAEAKAVKAAEPSKTQAPDVKPKSEEPAKPAAEAKAAKAAEPAKAPAPDVKQKLEEPAKPAADMKAAKAAEPTKAPATDVKHKPEEPAKPAADMKATKAAEPAQTPASDVKPKSEEPVKPVADVKAAKAAEAAKAPAADVKPKPEEPIKTAAEAKATKAAEATKAPATDVKPKPEAVPEQEVEIPKDFKMPINQKASESVTTLPLHEIKSFEGHPFSVKDDKDMQELVESVKRFGILEPVVVIPCKEYGYEMVSGHRRLRACQLAGITRIPVIVRNLDRDEAIISMVDANLKRENITPMEKARAYEMKLAAMKRKAGRRSKAEAAKGEKPVHAIDELAKQTGESRPTIQRIVRLNKLEPELQQMVDKKELPVNTAADISYLKKEEQKALADAIQKEAKVPSGTQAAELKKASQAGTLTQEKIHQTVAPTKREENPPLKVTFSDDELRAYFPDKGVTVPDVKRAVFEGLDLRKRVLERQKANAQQGKNTPAKNQMAR